MTAPTLYHHFGDKEGLLAAVVEFGWASFLESKRNIAAVAHQHVADDIRAGWDNHMEFARENPNFYKLMWSAGVAANSTAFRDAYQILYKRMELGASRGQLRVSAERAAQMIMAATTGAALSAISQPGMYGDVSFATQLREAVIASVTVAPSAPTSKRPVRDEMGQLLPPQPPPSRARSPPKIRRSLNQSRRCCSSGSQRWPIRPHLNPRPRSGDHRVARGSNSAVTSLPAISCSNVVAQGPTCQLGNRDEHAVRPLHGRR